MRLAKRLPLFPALLFVIAGAHSQEIHYNYDRGTNFAAYKTYEWADVPNGPARGSLPSSPPAVELGADGPPIEIPGGGPLEDSRARGGDDQLIEQEIKRAVDEQLAQKGLTRVETGGDIQVVYQAAIHQEKSLNLSGMVWGGRASGLWDGSLQGQTSTIPIGTILVSLYDPARKQLIWRGDATNTIELKKNPDKNYKTLQKAMSKLFRNYPPRPYK